MSQVTEKADVLIDVLILEHVQVHCFMFPSYLKENSKLVHYIMELMYLVSIKRKRHWYLSVL